MVADGCRDCGWLRMVAGPNSDFWYPILPKVSLRGLARVLLPSVVSFSSSSVSYISQSVVFIYLSQLYKSVSYIANTILTRLTKVGGSCTPRNHQPTTTTTGSYSTYQSLVSRNSLMPHGHCHHSQSHDCTQSRRRVVSGSSITTVHCQC